MIDSMPVMAWRCRPDGFVEFLTGDASNTSACLRPAVWIGWTIAIDADDLNRCAHLIQLGRVESILYFDSSYLVSGV